MPWQPFPAAILGFRSLQFCSKRAAQLILQPTSCQTLHQWMMPAGLRLTPRASTQNRLLGRDSDLPR